MSHSEWVDRTAEFVDRHGNVVFQTDIYDGNVEFTYDVNDYGGCQITSREVLQYMPMKEAIRMAAWIMENCSEKDDNDQN